MRNWDANSWIELVFGVLLMLWLFETPIIAVIRALQGH